MSSSTGREGMLKEYSSSQVLKNGHCYSQWMSEIWLGHVYRRLHDCANANSGRLSLEANNLLADMSRSGWVLQTKPSPKNPRIRLEVYREVREGVRLYLTEDHKRIIRIDRGLMGGDIMLEHSSEGGERIRA